MVSNGKEFEQGRKQVSNSKEFVNRTQTGPKEFGTKVQNGKEFDQQGLKQWGIYQQDLKQ